MTYQEFIQALSISSGASIELVNKHINRFLEKITPDKQLDLEELELELLKTIASIKEEVDGLQ